MLQTPRAVLTDALPAPHASPTAEAAPFQSWHPAKRLAFRFAFVYSLLYCFPILDVISSIPVVGDLIGESYSNLWLPIVQWTGKHVLGIGYDITVLPNGSGDTTFNYVQVFCFLIVATVAALVWTVLDRKRSEYGQLHEWLRVYVRFALATAMIVYGAAKVFQSQFPTVTLDRLVQPIGDASPMGMLWTFMATSPSYAAFAGGVELLGGLLLIFRRTTTLGALVSAGAMTNVVLLNFCYDVPVKLYSSHLLLACVFLLLPEMKRLANFFVFNRVTEPAERRPLFARPSIDRGAAIVSVAFMLAFAGYSLFTCYQDEISWNARTQAPRYGIWQVEEFELDGEARPPVEGDPARWRRVVFDFPGVLAIQAMTDTRERYFLDLDEEAKTIALGKRSDPDWKAEFSFEELETDVMTWQGAFDGHAMRARLRRIAPPEFRLTNRGFHWVNEVPFNR